MKDINQLVGPQCKICKFSTDPNMKCSNTSMCIDGALYERMTDYEIFLYHNKPLYIENGVIARNLTKPLEHKPIHDAVNHPKHYKTSSGLEAIDVIKAFTEGLEGIEATDTGNIIKYALRWKNKNGVEDLKKIVWYANHLIEHLESTKVDKVQKEIGDKHNHFVCPCCGGKIVRDTYKIEGEDIIVEARRNPYCKQCNTQFMVIVNHDFSYDIVLLKDMILNNTRL